MISNDDIFDYMASQLSTQVEMPTHIDVDLCTNCMKHGNIFENTCRNCGYTSNTYIFEGAEWKGGVSEDGVAHDPSRVGMASNPLYSSQWGKATLMNVGRGQHAKYRLASKINLHAGMNHRDRALHKAYDDFERAGKLNMGLSDRVIITAKAYYKKITETSLTRGAVRTGAKANCLFWACKDAGVPRTTQEIAKAFGIDTKDVSRTADKVKDIIHPRKNDITMPSDMVQRIFMSLGVNASIENRKTKMKCIRLCDSLKGCSKLMGKTPIAVAASVIMNELQLTKQEISKAVGVSAATISKIDNIVKDWNSK
jgi:transcription initiation factor TFIIB